jgi:hypothetical protein
MPDDDPFAHARYLAAKQVNEDMRRDESWLWHFSNVSTWPIRPWLSLRLWWIDRSVRR